MKNWDRVFKSSKRPAASKNPDFMTYGPTAADCIKQTRPNPVDLFLLMYPPTLEGVHCWDVKYLFNSNQREDTQSEHG